MYRYEMSSIVMLTGISDLCTACLPTKDKEVGEIFDRNLSNPALHHSSLVSVRWKSLKYLNQTSSNLQP